MLSLPSQDGGHTQAAYENLTGGLQSCMKLFCDSVVVCIQTHANRHSYIPVALAVSHANGSLAITAATFQNA